MKLQLPSIFSNHMVLQRRKHVLVWGKATVGSKVSVSIAGQKIETLAQDGTWKVKLNPMEAGGPYEMIICSADEEICYQNVLVGEVWLAGGQSNMELELQNSDNGKQVIQETQDERIRFFYTPKITTVCKELEEAERKNSWMECKPNETATWSAVGYYFAKKLSKELDVPVGIIGCNWGGTIADNWVSRESLLKHQELAHFVQEYDELVAKQDYDMYVKELAEYKVYHAEWEKKTAEFCAQKPDATWDEMQEYAGICKWPGPMGPLHEYRPAGLYESMVLRVAPYTLSGALYYQGESDEDNHTVYRLLLQNLIEEWRRLWKDDELSFAIVQLPVYAGTGEKTGYGWGAIRKAQQDVYRTIKNTSLTVITDCGEAWNIHPTDKETVGTRLAENVLKDIFARKEFEGNGPCATDFTITNIDGQGAIKVSFAGAEECFYRAGKKVIKELLLQEESFDGFEIAGEDGVYMPAKVCVDGASLVLYDEQVANPIKSRYGCQNYFKPELTDKNGRPVMPFWME